MIETIVDGCMFFTLCIFLILFNGSLIYDHCIRVKQYQLNTYSWTKSVYSCIGLSLMNLCLTCDILSISLYPIVAYFDLYSYKIINQLICFSFVVAFVCDTIYAHLARTKRLYHNFSVLFVIYDGAAILYMFFVYHHINSDKDNVFVIVMIYFIYSNLFCKLILSYLIVLHLERESDKMFIQFILPSFIVLILYLSYDFIMYRIYIKLLLVFFFICNILMIYAFSIKKIIKHYRTRDIVEY
jgi:hypothetical protein